MRFATGLFLCAVVGLCGCAPAPTVPAGAKTCNRPADCNYPMETCGFTGGWNTVAICAPNDDDASKKKKTAP